MHLYNILIILHIHVNLGISHLHTFEPEETEHILSNLRASLIMLGAWHESTLELWKL